jgi:hypothetical protein
MKLIAALITTNLTDRTSEKNCNCLNSASFCLENSAVGLAPH